MEYFSSACCRHIVQLPLNTGSREGSANQAPTLPSQPIYHSQMPAISFNVSTSRIPMRR